MKTYRLDPDKLKEQTRNIYLMYGITLVVLLVLNYFMSRGREVTNSTYLTYGLIVVMFLFVGWNAVKQRKTIWDQYEIGVDEKGISQKQPKAADVFLPRAEISGMKESKFGLTLMVKDQHPVMGIPKMLKPADYEEIKALVEEWLKTAKPLVLDVEAVEEAAPVIEEHEVLDVVSEPEAPATEKTEEQDPNEPQED